MSQATSLSQSSVPEGYAQRTIQVEGRDLTFTFYMGFVSRLTHTPRGGKEVLVYQQEGVFKVPGGVAPEPRTKLWITGGPDELDVELEVNDGPIGPPDFQGPIQGFQVVTRRAGGEGASSNPRVRPGKGAAQVASIRVEERGRGGVFPHMPPGDGGTTDVTNTAQTCPPHC
jgi:hypothetical protein